MKTDYCKDKISLIKVVIGVVLCLVTLTLGQSAMFIIQSKMNSILGNIVSAIVYISIVYLLLKLICQKLLRINITECKITKVRVQMKWIAVGILLPSVVMAILFLSKGTFTTNSFSLKESLYIITNQIFASAFAAAIVEEMIFRGVMYTIFEKRWNKSVAIIIPAMIFPLGHLGYSKNAVDILLVFVAGITVSSMFAMVARESNSIWNSVFIHFVWNIFMVRGIFSFNENYSPEVIFSYLLPYKVKVISGGNFGIESSFISVVAYILVILIAIYFINRSGEKDEK